jgi:hypothetical protein
VTEPNTVQSSSPWSLAGIGFVVIALLAVIVLGGARSERGTTMMTSDSVQEVVIPPIDAMAPTVTETATFALG